MVNKMKPDDKTELSYESFRPKVVVDDIAAFPKDDINYTYKAVIINYKHLPHNVETHEKEGYEIVYSKKVAKDDRAFSPDNNQSEKTVLQPVMKTSADGYQYLLMRISKKKEEENSLKRQKAELDLYTKSVRSVSKKGNTLKAVGDEINFNKPGDE